MKKLLESTTVNEAVVLSPPVKSDSNKVEETEV